MEEEAGFKGASRLLLISLTPPHPLHLHTRTYVFIQNGGSDPPLLREVAFAHLVPSSSVGPKPQLLSKLHRNQGACAVRKGKTGGFEAPRGQAGILDLYPQYLSDPLFTEYTVCMQFALGRCIKPWSSQFNGQGRYQVRSLGAHLWVRAGKLFMEGKSQILWESVTGELSWAVSNVESG